MASYLIRIFEVRWDRLEKRIRHKPIASKAIKLPRNHDINTIKHVLELVTQEFVSY